MQSEAGVINVSRTLIIGRANFITVLGISSGPGALSDSDAVAASSTSRTVMAGNESGLGRWGRSGRISPPQEV